jgi:hypothetical protein
MSIVLEYKQIIEIKNKQFWLVMAPNLYVNKFVILISFITTNPWGSTSRWTSISYCLSLGENICYERRMEYEVKRNQS